MATRQIIKIDELLCNGCGVCVPSCAEGALEIVDGKVRVHEDRLCDGLGACIGECPEGALTIEEREASEYDQAAVEERLALLGRPALAHHHHEPAIHAHDHAPAPVGGGCPGSLARVLGGAEASAPAVPETARSGESLLGHWPVQLGLINPYAPFLRGSDLLVAADCAPVAYRLFHEEFLAGRSVVVACPKLDDAQAHLEKLTEVFAAAKPASVTVLHMEVPCCFGLSRLVHQAAEGAGLTVPINEIMITVAGTAEPVQR